MGGLIGNILPGITNILKLDQNVETLSANKTLVVTDMVVQKLDPNGADRDVTLPAEAISTDLLFWLYNTGGTAGEDLVIKSDAPTTLGTIGPGQMGIFHCDGTTWKWLSDTGIKYDSVAGSVIFPQSNDAATPTLAFGDGNTGFFESSDNVLDISITGISRWKIDSQFLYAALNYGASLSKNASTSTTPALTFTSDEDTGIGHAAADALSLIAGGVEGIRITENSSKIDEIKLNGPRVDSLYTWIEDFDDEVAAVQFEAGLVADFWVTAGTNYAAANVTYTAGSGGTLDAKCAAVDNDSVTILGVTNFNTDQNPIMEARFKIDDKATAACFVGFSAAAFADKATPANDMFCVGIDSDNGHGFGATQIVSLANDAAAGGDYDDMGVAIVNDTYIIVKIDLTDTEQPRVWINNTEVAAGNILSTVQAATAVAPYIHVQNLAGGAIQRTITIDYIKCWQDRG